MQKRFATTLIVDDNPTSRFLTRLVLEEMNVTQQIIEMPHGQAALDYIVSHCLGDQAREQCPDWIILNLSMPVMDGFELLAQLQALEQNVLLDKAVTVLTSSANSSAIAQTTAYGITAFFTKPLMPEGVEALIQKFNSRNSSQ